MTEGKSHARRIRFSAIGFVVLTTVLLVFSMSLIVVYTVPQSSSWAVRWSHVAPYPLAVVDFRRVITFSELSRNIRSVRQFYENQDFSKVGLRVDFDTADGQKRLKVREKEVLNKMIEDEAIMALSHDRGISVSLDAAAQGVQRKIEEYGSSEAVRRNLDQLYGWTLDDFEQKVVLPSMYEEKLQAAFQKETDPVGKAQEVIRLAQSDLREGADFSEVAKRYSEGRTGKTGGELGWFALEDLTSELRQPVSGQKVGVAGDIVESTLGFHIVFVEETKKEGDRTLYHLKQIFVHKKQFSGWLTEEMKRMSIYVFSSEYRWNNEEARADFKDQELRDFEKKLDTEANGDATFFF